MTATTERPRVDRDAHDATQRAAAHLRPETMAVAQRHLVTKALSELAHERLLAPVRDDAAEPVPVTPTGDADDDDERASRAYRVTLDEGRVVYRFRARRLSLEHWAVDEASVTRDVEGRPAPLDAMDLVLELQPLLRIPDHLLAVYLEEIASTLASGAFKVHHGGPSAADLVGAPLWEVEAAMTEGHPSFVANNGRIGFGLAEHAAYSPEAARPVRLVWLAVRRETSHLALGDGLDEDGFYLGELGGATLARFHAQLHDLGLDPAEYRWLPVHPWQWEHRLAVTFAPDLARRDLVLLGTGEDDHLPQQSIRTLLNVSDPTRHYVKVALAIQNMGFLRGLSPAYMRATPAINDWVADVVASDPVLAGLGFRVLRERVSIGYTGDAYHRTPQPNAHRKMVAALWRESPVALVPPTHRLATMASLLHRDPAGASYVGALVAASGLDAATWVRRYLDVYLTPVVHCLLAHDLAFMPHGENVILELDGHAPVGAFLKDIGEEVVVLTDRPLPEQVARVRHPVDAAEAALAVFTDVFDGVLRHLAAVLDSDGVLDEREFWALVAACLDDHAAAHPDLHGRVDLRASRFAHSCLNRLQLRNTAQMVDLADPSGSLIYAGTLANPVARGRRA